MKKIIIISALLAIAGIARAANYISVDSPAELPQGGIGYIDVKFNFDQDKYFANYSFDVYLPEGITLNQDKIVMGDCHSANHPAKYTIGVNDGFYSLAILSIPTTALTGTDGILVRLAVDVSEDLELNSVINGGAIKRIRFANTLGSTTKFDDFEFDIKIVENVVVFDENESLLPAYNSGATANVTMKRSIKANQWSTIVLPFTLNQTKAKDIFGDDVQLATFSSFETTYADDDDVSPDAIQMKFETYALSARKPLTGGKPFIIKTSKDIDEFPAEDVTLVSTITDQSGKDQDDITGKFTGSFVKTVIPEDGLFISGNNFYYSKGTTNIKGFRGWFELNAVLGKDIDFGTKIRFSVDGEATSIDGISEIEKVADGIYTLSGQKLDSDVKALPKGVYIVNGKKVYVK